MAFMENCGLMLEPQEGMSVDEILEWATYAEKSGYGYIFRSDHLLSTSKISNVPSPECWVTLGAIAARTERVKFGPMVSPIGFRNPAVLANMACTLHSFSRKRLILSVGAGWFQSEYEAYGIPFPELKRRKEEFHEALQILRPLTEGKHVSFRGKYFSADVECFPRPDPKIHLVIGGRDSRIIRWAAEFADELNMYNPSDEWVEKARKILESTPRGKNVLLSQMGPFYLGESESDLRSRISKFLKANGMDQNVDEAISGLRERGAFCGTPDEFSSQIAARKKAGVDKFYFQVSDPQDKIVIDILTKMLRKK
ncbi:MAG: LLM class flavin-dependent oxidoreductase [Thaumarchaeota archaeon]|nr:LLM class flavin-dependent oxidoreductase [Nitrososphaerota archaeon]